MVRAANDSLSGKMGKIHFENVFTDLNGIPRHIKCLNSNLRKNLPMSYFSGDWNPRGSVFMCKEPGLYFFSFSARGEPMNDYSDRIKEPQMDWLYVTCFPSLTTAQIF